MHKKKTLRKGTKYPRHAFTYYFLFFFALLMENCLLGPGEV